MKSRAMVVVVIQDDEKQVINNHEVDSVDSMEFFELNFMVEFECLVNLSLAVIQRTCLAL